MTISKYIVAAALAVAAIGFVGATNEASAYSKPYPRHTSSSCHHCNGPSSSMHHYPSSGMRHTHHWQHRWWYRTNHWNWRWHRPVYTGSPVYTGRPIYAGPPVYSGRPVVTQASAPSCSCLRKEYLPDGRTMFKDVCSREEAVSEMPAK